MAKIVAAISSLESRFREMYPKGGYNQQDQLALENAIRSAEHIIGGFAARLRENGNLLGGQLRLFGGAKLSEAQLRMDAGGILNRIGIGDAALDRVQLRPLRVFAERLDEKRELLREALLQRDRERAEDLAVQLNVIAKFHGVQVCFERLRQFMAAGDSVPAAAIRDFVGRLTEVYHPLQLFPQRRVGGYQEPFEALKAGLDHISERLQAYSGGDVGVGQRTLLYRSLREYLDRFDLEAIVRALP